MRRLEKSVLIDPSCGFTPPATRLPACLEARHLWAELFVTWLVSESSCFDAQKLL